MWTTVQGFDPSPFIAKKIFEWSTPTEILSDISILTFYLAFYLTYILTFYVTFYLTYIETLYLAFYPTYILTFWHIFWHSFWHSIEYLFGDSLWGLAGITLIQRLLFGSGGDHCDHELSVEVEEDEAGGWGTAGFSTPTPARSPPQKPWWCRLRMWSLF